jgi:hypothetical protein
VVSVKSPVSPSEPYTSSVETWRKRKEEEVGWQKSEFSEEEALSADL